MATVTSASPKTGAHTREKGFEMTVEHAGEALELGRRSARRIARGASPREERLAGTFFFLARGAAQLGQRLGFQDALGLEVELLRILAVPRLAESSARVTHGALGAHLVALGAPPGEAS